MICALWEDRVNDFVDGTAAKSEALEVERHLEACDDCSAGASRLRSVLTDVSALSDRIEPPRDLWPAIASDLSRQLARRRRPAIFAAVLVLAAAALTSTLWRMERFGPAPPSSGGIVSASTAGPDLAEAEEEFRLAMVKVMEALRRTPGGISPEIISELENNLRVVNQAIAETRAASARDPGNHRLGRLLTDMYVTKVNLLATAARLAGTV